MANTSSSLDFDHDCLSDSGRDKCEANPRCRNRSLLAVTCMAQDNIKLNRPRRRTRRPICTPRRLPR